MHEGASGHGGTPPGHLRVLHQLGGMAEGRGVRGRAAGRGVVSAIWACTRAQLIDAIAGLTVTVPGSGPAEGLVVADWVADAILQALGTPSEDVPAAAEAAIRADERARIRSLLPYNVNCCDGFPAAVADMIGEHGDAQ